jgi:chromosome partitioning protein
MEMRMACKIVVLSGGKGGVGRSTLSRNFIVGAMLAGFRTLGFDLDRQATFHKWHQRREKTRQENAGCLPTDVRLAHVSDWRSIVSATEGYDVAIIDTAPGIEENMASMLSLAQASAFVVVPCGVSHDDIESVVPWVNTLNKHKVHAAFVFNKVNRRTKSFGVARATLIRHGAVCPIEIPLLEDIHVPAAQGLCALDFENARGGESLESVWRFVRREAGL